MQFHRLKVDLIGKIAKGRLYDSAVLASTDKTHYRHININEQGLNITSALLGAYITC